MTEERKPDNPPAQNLDGCLSEIYLHTGSVLDLSKSVNRAKFLPHRKNIIFNIWNDFKKWVLK